MHNVDHVFYYPGVEGWFMALRYQCRLSDDTLIYARSSKHLARKLKRRGIEVPALSEPQWTGIGTQHLVYDKTGQFGDVLEVLKERYDG